MDKTRQLENLLLTRTSQEAAEFFKAHRVNINEGRALAVACRFCGLEHTRALVESGASFKVSEDPYDQPYYCLAPLKFREAQRGIYFADECEDWYEDKIRRDPAEAFPILPEEQRAEIAAYLCERSGRTYCVPGELLFFSILCRNQIITARLREMGVTFTKGRIRGLTKSPRNSSLNEFVDMLTALENNDFTDAIREIVKEVGGHRLCYNKCVYAKNSFSEYSLYGSMKKRFFNPDLFRVILENFRFIAEDRECLLMELIDKNQTQCLAMCAERGWLRQPHKCDAIIEYAAGVKSVECTAWLLDYKNREFDLAAERAKAEKEAMHELNAPDSIAAMKKTWRWKKQADGTLAITGYKGTDTVINVPPNIGRRSVTAVGYRAFDKFAVEIGGKRRKSRKVILPFGIRSIGESSFAFCRAFEEITIPDSVAEIGKAAFYYCSRISAINIPSSVGEIADDVFWCCRALRSIKLPAGIKRIGNNAFGRCISLEEIVVPDGTSEIGEMAFENCEKLRTVVIPASVKAMGKDVFHGSDNVTVIVTPNSFAEEYCKRNNVSFKYSDA